MSLSQNQGTGSSAFHVNPERVGREASENRNALLVAFAVANERAPALSVSIEMHVLAIERLQLCPANTGSIEKLQHCQVPRRLSSDKQLLNLVFAECLSQACWDFR